MKSVKTPTAAFENKSLVKNRGALRNDAPLNFTFSHFRLYPINIDGVFNNHFKTPEEYIRKMTVFLGEALPLLSTESQSIFSDKSKRRFMHLHKLDGKEVVLQQIFEAYEYNEHDIESFFEGGEIYQLEMLFDNGATRIIFERIRETISFLFLDPNHHIYLDKEKVDRAKSLFFEYCPINQAGTCERMNVFHTCFAFEYLDEDLYYQSFDCNYTPR